MQTKKLLFVYLRMHKIHNIFNFIRHKRAAHIAIIIMWTRIPHFFLFLPRAEQRNKVLLTYLLTYSYLTTQFSFLITLSVTRKLTEIWTTVGAVSFFPLWLVFYRSFYYVSWITTGYPLPTPSISICYELRRIKDSSGPTLIA